MQIFKVISNNMVSIKAADGQEELLKGLSIGYKKKPGDMVDEDRIEKHFVLDNKNVRYFNELIKGVNQEIIDACVKVMEEIQGKSEKLLSDSLYVTIIDHIVNYIDRLKDNIVFDNTILWDLKRIYPEEYRLAKETVRSLNEMLPIAIDENEASFITLHIVNAEKAYDMNKTYHIAHFINDICDIVSSNLDMEFEEDDYYFNRFIMHLRFLVENIEMRIALKSEGDNDLLEMLVEKYPLAFRVMQKIDLYISECLHYRLNKEEQLYLMMHISVLVKQASKK